MRSQALPSRCSCSGEKQAGAALAQVGKLEFVAAGCAGGKQYGRQQALSGKLDHGGYSITVSKSQHIAPGPDE